MKKKRTILIFISILLIQFLSNNDYTLEPDEILKNKNHDIRARNISKNISGAIFHN